MLDVYTNDIYPSKDTEKQLAGTETVSTLSSNKNKEHLVEVSNAENMLVQFCLDELVFTWLMAQLMKNVSSVFVKYCILCPQHDQLLYTSHAINIRALLSHVHEKPRLHTPTLK